MQTRIKICGLRSPERAAEIAKMGADAIGLVFAESPRRVTPAQARMVTDALPPAVAAVGVFVDTDAETINRIVAEASLTMAQLHGDEPPEIVTDLTVPVIKAFRVRDAGWIDEVSAWLDGVQSLEHVAAVLLDAYVPGVAGGTGERFNWDWVTEAREAGRLEAIPPLILSGGLDTENVAEAIRIVQPWMVDVSSGVESAPGVKDLSKVEAFIRAARQQKT
ncbi:MAG: phosphoribosylanthranilate isomerase [Planctomycetota bacterium]|nr:phosphoribosylanthranilate isomerase [Planctomycetota bacterium]